MARPTLWAAIQLCPWRCRQQRRKTRYAWAISTAAAVAYVHLQCQTPTKSGAPTLNPHRTAVCTTCCKPPIPRILCASRLEKKQQVVHLGRVLRFPSVLRRPGKISPHPDRFREGLERKRAEGARQRSSSNEMTPNRPPPGGRRGRRCRDQSSRRASLRSVGAGSTPGATGACDYRCTHISCIHHAVLKTCLHGCHHEEFSRRVSFNWGVALARVPRYFFGVPVL